MLISVALCTYNGESYLREQLMSIIEQILHVDEIVICDDLSTDGTLDIILQLQEEFPGIIRFYINQTNLGAKRNFEKAISLCKGDYIFLSDQDDIWLNTKTQRYISEFEKNPESFALFSNAFLINKHGELIKGKTIWSTLFFSGIIPKSSIIMNLFEYILLRGNVVCGATLCIRKKVKEIILPFKNLDLLWHDEWIALKLSISGNLGLINEELIYYRIHDKQEVGVPVGENPQFEFFYNFMQSIIYNTSTPPNFNNESVFLMGYIHNKIQTLAPLFEISNTIKTFVEKNYLMAKISLLMQQPFVIRKLRLVKWYLRKTHNTTFKEIFTLGN